MIVPIVPNYILDGRDKKVVIHAIDGKEMRFIRLSAEEFTRSKESMTLRSDDPELFKKKMRLLPSLEDMTLNANVSWTSRDHKKHKLFQKNGFENFRGKVGIDSVIFNYIVRAGKANFSDIFYDINLEVDQYLPHATGASDIKRSTSNMDTIPQTEPVVNTQTEKTPKKPGEVKSQLKTAVTPQLDEEYKDFDKPITMKDVETLRSIGRKSVKDFASDDIRKAAKWAHKFYKELGVKSPFFRAWFGDWRAHSTDGITVAEIPSYIASNEARKANRGSVENADTGWGISISREGETNTISHSGVERLSEFGLAGIRNLVERAILLDTEVHEHHKNNAVNDNIAFDHKLYALGKSQNSIGLYRITVEERFQDPKHTNEKRFHNLKYIEKVADVPVGAYATEGRKSRSAMGSSTTKYSIANLYELVKTYDKDFSAGELKMH